MAAILPGILNFKQVVKGDLFDVTIDFITAIDCTGKNFSLQVKKDPNSTLILEFEESDGSLTVGVASAVPNTLKTTRTIRFYKPASEMMLNESIYRCGLMIWSDASDKQTFFAGTFQIVAYVPEII